MIAIAGAGYCRISWKHPDTSIWRAIKDDLRATFTCEYEPDRKSWLVYASVAQVYCWATQHFGADEIDCPSGYRDDQRRHEHTGTTNPDALTAAYASLHLLPSAPRELAQAAYRVLARAHHPDRGGDHEVMVRINHAADLLRARGAL